MPVDGVDFVETSEDANKTDTVPMDELLKLNRDRLHDFTKAMQECEFVEEIEEKNSQTKGRGDLQRRRFTFFEYIILTKPDRPL